MANVLVGPAHDVPPLVYVGVTTMVADIGAVVVLVAVNDKLPVPLPARPIAVFEFVQE